MSKQEIERFHQEYSEIQRCRGDFDQAKDDPGLVALTLEVGKEKGYNFRKPTLKNISRKSASWLARATQRCTARSRCRGERQDFDLPGRLQLLIPLQRCRLKRLRHIGIRGGAP